VRVSLRDSPLDRPLSRPRSQAVLRDAVAPIKVLLVRCYKGFLSMSFSLHCLSVLSPPRVHQVNKYICRPTFRFFCARDFPPSDRGAAFCSTAFYLLVPDITTVTFPSESRPVLFPTRARRGSPPSRSLAHLATKRP